jgi:uncharacterized protein YkwD
LNQPLRENFSKVVRNTVIQINEDSYEQSVRVNFPRLNQSLLFFDEASENKLLALINKERLDRGLQKLDLETRLREAAREHSKDMFVREYVGHFDEQGIGPAERLYAKDIRFEFAGENLSHAPEIETAHAGLMNSVHHRENILSPDYSRVGIGIVEAPEYGFMITQLFTD